MAGHRNDIRGSAATASAATTSSAPSPASPKRRPTGRPLRRAIKRVLPTTVATSLGQAWPRLWSRTYSIVNDPMQLRRPRCERECPICGFRGHFWSFGSPPRAEAQCPDCLSLERHRLLQLLLDRRMLGRVTGKRVLHFAPEGFVRERLGRRTDYVTADIATGNVDCKCGLEEMPFSDDSFSALVANHVLEHVKDEKRALSEIRRVVADEGIAVLSVPIVYGWEQTYEDESITAPADRRAHFGQEDHQRIYGQDFASRLQRAGFDVEIFTVDPGTEVRYGLTRGEQIFIARPQAMQRHAAGTRH